MGDSLRDQLLKSGIVKQVRDEKRPPPSHGKPARQGAGKAGAKGGKPAGERPRDKAEIDLARDRALENYKLMIRGAEIRASAVDANLADLRTRIANIQKAGRKVGSGLQEQLDQAVRESEELKRTVQKNQNAMVQVREKYEADKLRFRELTGK